MNAKSLVRLAPVVLACQLLAAAALAQQPSAAAVALGRDLVEAKGANAMFEPILISVIEQTKGALLQTNPQLAKDLNDVANQLRTELAPRRAEIINEAGKFYATAFTEAELKDLVAFYKSPIGKKMQEREPGVLDQTFNFVQQQWGPRVGEEVMNRFRAEMKKKGHNL
ncbi:MAG: DUF2059 domain-containing protein [Alphaproteobacteria bacterium]|nr:MAG: DUF2059 domain-containing protein [Alphaproteobacteria bacterium]